MPPNLAWPRLSSLTLQQEQLLAAPTQTQAIAPAALRSASYLLTSESVGEGHPDKLCDQISDHLLDHILRQEPEARVAIETMATGHDLFIAGEIRCAQYLLTPQKVEKIARQVVRQIGYLENDFPWQKINVHCLLQEQSREIARGVDGDKERQEGAGDQGTMFGYACRESPHLMPASLALAHALLLRLSQKRHQGTLARLGPDAKSQITLRYQDGKPRAIERIVLSTQHHPSLDQDELRDLMIPEITAITPRGWVCPPEAILVNPTGSFTRGGPGSDTGLTGRKIIVDTYGGAAPHGGGAFSGKDPTKVDRSAAYAARYVAKNIVAAGLAQQCTLQVSYAIGIADPLSLSLDTQGTAQVPEDDLLAAVCQLFSFRPQDIRQQLRLNRPIYSRTATYGHFGRLPEADGGFSWERLDLAPKLRHALDARLR